MFKYYAHSSDFSTFSYNMTFLPFSRGLTGYVDEIEGIRTFPLVAKKVFAFILNNGANRRIKVLIWNEDIERYVSRIRRFQVCRTFLFHSFAYSLIQILLSPHTGQHICDSPY